MADIYDRRYGPYPDFDDGRFEKAVDELKIAIEEKRKMVRAKFRLDAITKYGYGGTAFIFNAVSDDKTEENRKFNIATPAGKLEVWVDNPRAIEKFEINKNYYLDFIPAD